MIKIYNNDLILTLFSGNLLQWNTKFEINLILGDLFQDNYWTISLQFSNVKEHMKITQKSSPYSDSFDLFVDLWFIQIYIYNFSTSTYL